MKRACLFIGLWIAIMATPALAAFTEPIMSDYQAVPIFTADTVTPNIMIILDNSGSMNSPAYSDSFQGAPYFSGDYPVVSADDDMEGSGAPDTTPDNQLWDLDMGEQIVGLRFQDIQIAQGATITSAYIEFVACDSDSVATSLTIEGEDSDNALPFSATNPITSRSVIGTSVPWNSLDAWTSGTHYDSPDITAIVQEIVNRSGWVRGNAMVFRITGSGERDAHPRDSGSTNMPILHIETDTHGKRYYGYFNPDYFYEYTSNIYIPVYQKVGFDSGGTSWTVKAFDSATETLSATESTLTAAQIDAQYWDGNFMNWLTMRRVDVLRKVMAGGLSNSRQGGGKQSVNGEDPQNGSYSESFNKSMNTTDSMPVCPYHGDYSYQINNAGDIVVSGATYDIEIQKEPVIEPEDFDSDGELAGVLQRIGDKARWGVTWFNSGYNGQNGGDVKIAIDGAAMANMISDLTNQRCTTSTPLAETLYVVMQYFKQEALSGVSGYPSDCLPNPIGSGSVKDPYYNQTLGVLVPCAKSFVILLTDGAPTADGVLPSYLRDADGDGNSKDTACTDCTTDNLDDVAFYARTNDLRVEEGMEGDQNLYLYTIFAFADDNTARQLLMDAARNGGFDDRNDNNKPDGDYDSPPEDRLEWDKDGDAIPDTYFEASDGYALEARLLSAITDILKRAASGTAASVLSNNNQGAGTSVQAYFKPVVQEGLEEAMWQGYMKSLWVDPWGNLREDTNGNLKLDLFNDSETNTASSNVDRIIEHFNDGDEVKIRIFTQSPYYNPAHGYAADCDPESEDCSVDSIEVSMDNIQPIFEAGERLAAMNPDDRHIFTYIDEDEDGVVDSGEVIDFTTTNASALTPYLGVRNGTVWGDSGLGLGSSHEDRVDNIITWVRGTDVDGLRNRTLAGTTWPLGDIVNSTPMLVGLPQEYYHELYADLEYLDFIKAGVERETVIYVGANDGMLHAFTSWINRTDYTTGDIEFEKPAGVSGEIGDELWAYIPQAVLPHLKWTAHSDYTHTYYVDGPVRVFDAKILPDNTHYEDDDNNPNFGTFLVFGLNMGGKEISVSEDFGSGSTVERTFYPSYVMMDVTDPRNPQLMWERSYPELGMTTCTPAPAHVGSRDGSGSWYLVFGSGPTDYDGISDQKGHIFVVDMATGDPIGSGGDDWIATSSHNSYFNEPLVLDIYQSHNADAIFLANNYISANAWQSDIWKIAVPCSKCAWDVDPGTGMPLYDVTKDELEYSDNPVNWLVNQDFFAADGAISAQLSSTIDPIDNLLIYAGTGRFYSQADREDTNQQYLYCIKDPFYNPKYDGAQYHNFGSPYPLAPSDLINSSNIYTVASDVVGALVFGYGTTKDFFDFVAEFREKEDGWYLPLQVPDSSPAERILTQTAILGGVQITPTFFPNDDICAQGGDTSFLGSYYETGTGYTFQLFDIDESNIREVTIGEEPAEIIEIRDDDLYKGMPATKAVFHVGKESGATISTQVSTGEFIGLKTNPYLYIGNMATEWWDDPSQVPDFGDGCN